MRRQRRTRLSCGATKDQLFELVFGPELRLVGMAEEMDEAQARALWERHRDKLMAERFEGHVPNGLVRCEPQSFASLAATRALRLELNTLKTCHEYFVRDRDWHKRNGRVAEASAANRRAANVLRIVGELEGAK